jgi:phosphoribosylglycinamide formyltransferase-1
MAEAKSVNKKRLAVFVSGGGTNLQAIIDASLPSVEIVLVLSNNPGAYALERARKHGITVEVVDHRQYSVREEYDKYLLEVLARYRVDLIALAGFMRILSPLFVKAYKNRIVNIHPALLPAFQGVHAARQALESGVKYTGVTVHFVDEGVDTGPIILQAAVPVMDDDDEESLLERIHKEEHRIYPEAINLIARGKFMIQGKRVLRKP